MSAMNRGPVGNTSYPGYQGPPGPPNSMMGPQYGQYNNSNAPAGMPPNQSVPNAGMQQPPINNMAGAHMNSMASTGVVPPTSTASTPALPPTDLHSPGPKGAQVAAQAAMLAAANSARLRQVTASTTPPAHPPQSSPVPQLSPSQPSTPHGSTPAANIPAHPPPQQNTPNVPQPVPPNRGMYPGYMGSGGQHGGPMTGQYPMNQMPGGGGHMDSNMAPQCHGNGPVPHNYNMPNTSMPNQMMGHSGGGPNQMGAMGPGHNMPPGMPPMGGHPHHGPATSMPSNMPPGNMPGNMPIGSMSGAQQQPHPGLPGLPPNSGSDSRSNTPLLGQTMANANSSSESNDGPKMPTSDAMVTSAGKGFTTLMPPGILRLVHET